MSDGKQDEKLEIGASAKTQALQHSVVMKRELSRKVKFSKQFSFPPSSHMVMSLWH